MKKIKLFDPYIDKFEKIAINKVLESNFWASGAGNGNVEKFENKLFIFSSSKFVLNLIGPAFFEVTLFLVIIGSYRTHVLLFILAFLFNLHRVSNVIRVIKKRFFFI